MTPGLWTGWTTFRAAKPSRPFGRQYTRTGSDGNLVIVTVSRWGIECISQGAGTLTFRANILPTVDVTAHVSVHNDL